MINFMTRLCKVEDKAIKQEDNEGSDEDEEDNVVNEMEEVNERNLMRPIRDGPETRSSRKSVVI